VDVRLDQSEGVHMRERYISTVMETINPPVSPRLTDAKVIELWLRRQRSPLTRSVYRWDIRRLLRETGLKLPKTSALDLERFAESLAGSGLAPISQGRTLAAVRSLFRFAERIGYCANPAGGVDLPRTDNPLSERIMTEEDVGALIAHEPDERNRVLLTVLYMAGLRVSEACGLRWRNLQARGEAGQILVHGKGGRTRAVMLPAAVWGQLTALRGMASADAPVFRATNLDAGTSVDLPEEALAAVKREIGGGAPEVGGSGTDEEVGATGEGNDAADAKGEESDALAGVEDAASSVVIEVEEVII